MKLIFTVCILLFTISTHVNAVEYFSLGDWSIGSKRDVALSLFVESKEIEKKKRYTTTSDSIIGSNVPTKLTFKKGRLHSLEFQAYKGESEENAISSLKQILNIFSKQFGGGNLEGLTTSEGLNDELVSVIISQLSEQVEAGIKKTNEASGEPVEFDMILSFSTEYVADKNYLYGQYRYDSSENMYFVTLWEDKTFPEDRLPKAMIILKSGK